MCFMRVLEQSVICGCGLRRFSAQSRHRFCLAGTAGVAIGHHSPGSITCPVSACAGRTGWDGKPAPPLEAPAAAPHTHAASSSPLNGAVINPREPCPLFTYSPPRGKGLAAPVAHHAPVPRRCRQTPVHRPAARQSVGNPGWCSGMRPALAGAQGSALPRPGVVPGRSISRPATPGCPGVRPPSAPGCHC